MNLVSYFIRGLDLPIPPNYQILAQDTPKYIDDQFDGIAKTIYQFPGETDTGVKAGMAVSIVLNVLLILAIVCGIVYALRWKKRTDMFMYNNMEDGTAVGSTMF